VGFNLGSFLGGVVADVLEPIVEIAAPILIPVLGGAPNTPIGLVRPVVAGVSNIGATGSLGGQGAAGAAGGNGGSFMSTLPAKPNAVSILRIIAAGAGDSQVRTAARKAQISKTDLFDALTAIEVMGASELSRLERIAISDQIDRIFRPRKRPIISKGLKRTMKQMEFMMKFAKKFGGTRGHAHFTTRTTGHK